MTNISHQENVVLNENKEIYNPINVNTVSVIIKCLFCSIGIPLNVSIAATIIRLRRLRCSPRNVFLLGITLSYLSFSIPPAIELIYWGMYPIESVCHAYVAVAAVPQGLLVVNMLLALIDRYLAINHPMFHRRKMTTRFAGCLIITSSATIVFLMKFVYIAQLDTIRCEILLVQVNINFVTITALFASCIVLNIIIHRKTKTLLRESRTLKATKDDRDVSNDDIAVTPMSIHADREKVGEMEMEAARTLMIGLASLCAMPCLALIFNATSFACRLIYGQLACAKLLNIIPFIKEFSLTPAIYGPVIFLARNKELSAT